MSYSTILVTGAGFSAPAGIPSQKELLQGVDRYQPDMATPGAVEYIEAKMKVRDFVDGFFCECRRGSRPWHSVSLEDVYSVLDRAVAEGDSLPPFPPDEISAIRRCLDSCIARYLTTVSDTAEDSTYERLLGRLSEMYGQDWATVTTNWDMLWDRVILRYARNTGRRLSYGTSLFEITDGQAQRIASDQADPVVYKLHGSLDWLTCPCCHSVFVVADLRLTDPFLSGLKCPRCGDDVKTNPEPRLRMVLLTPTMLKSIANPTIRSIHDEAFHAIRMASKVIFVGYSIPEADHHLRYLFRKAIGRHTDVKVILKGPGVKTIMLRYKQLFGLSRRDFFCDGFETYFSL